MRKVIGVWWANLHIRYKLALGFALLIGLMLVSLGVNALARRSEDQAHSRYNKASSDALLAEQLKAMALQAYVRDSEAILAYLSRGPQEMVNSFKLSQESKQNALQLVAQIKASALDPQALSLIQSIQDNIMASQANVSDEIIPQAQQRGDAHSGTIGDIVTKLDALERMEGVTPEIVATAEDLKTLIIKFLPDPVTTLNSLQAISSQISRLNTLVENGSMPDAQKKQLLAQVKEAGTAINNFTTVDIVRIGLPIIALRDKIASVTQDAASYVDSQLQAQQHAQEDLRDAQRTTRRAQLLITVLVILAAVVLSLALSQTITRPITLLRDVTHSIAEGDYHRRANVTSNDELGQLAQSIDTMTAVIQRREQELRIATAKATDAARVKSEFLANISHELRTPLNAVIGFSDLLLMGVNGELNEKQHHQVERLRENGQRLLRLVNDILDLTRLEAKRVEMIYQPFSPQALVKRLTAQMAVLAESKHLAFTTEVDPDLPPVLVGDEQRIEQVVVNLLANAFKFTETGSVTLAVRYLPAEHQWRLAVHDTGIGIPPHALDLIFEEFRQVDGSPTRVHQGSGLGLAITRQLVHLMGGQVTVKSEIGQGSTFTIILPVIDQVPVKGEFLTITPEKN